MSSISDAFFIIASSSVGANLLTFASIIASNNSLASSFTLFTAFLSFASSTNDLKWSFCTWLKSNLSISSFACSLISFNSFSGSDFLSSTSLFILFTISSTSAFVKALSSISNALFFISSSSVGANLLNFASIIASNNSCASSFTLFTAFLSFASSTNDLKWSFCTWLKSNLSISSFVCAFKFSNSWSSLNPSGSTTDFLTLSTCALSRALLNEFKISFISWPSFSSGKLNFTSSI